MTDDNELLEYETEADAGEAADAAAVAAAGEAVKVRLDEPIVTVPTVSQHATCYTLVLDSDNERYVELLPEDPLRSRALVIVNDQPVVICSSRAQASSTANQVTSVPDPTGAYVPASSALSTTLELFTTAQMFVAATGTDPARVTVIAERRSA